MALRLAVAGDQAALQTLMAARSAERVAEYGGEVSFAELVAMWQAGRLFVVVNTTNADVINGAALLFHYKGVYFELLDVWLPAGVFNNTLRDRAFALFKEAVSRTGAGFASRIFTWQVPVGGVFDNLGNTASRFASFHTVKTSEFGVTRAYYNVPGSEIQARL